MDLKCFQEEIREVAELNPYKPHEACPRTPAVSHLVLEKEYRNYSVTSNQSNLILGTSLPLYIAYFFQKL